MHFAIATTALAFLAGLPTMLPGAGPPPPPRAGAGARPASAGPSLGAHEAEGEAEGNKEEGDVFRHKTTPELWDESKAVHNKLNGKIGSYKARAEGKSEEEEEEEMSSAEDELSVLREEILRLWQLWMEYYTCIVKRAEQMNRSGRVNMTDELANIAATRQLVHDAVKVYLPEKTLQSHQALPALVQEFHQRYKALGDLLEEVSDDDQLFRKVDGLMHLKPEVMGRVRDAWEALARNLNAINSSLWKMADSITDQSLLEEIHSKLDHFTKRREELFARLQSSIDGINDGISIDEFTSEEKVESLKSHPVRYRTMMVLYAMLESPASKGLLDWDEDGTTVLISASSDEELKELFASFGMTARERQRVSQMLRDWGFSGDLYSGRFSHPLFTRGNPFDIRRMRTKSRVSNIPKELKERSKGCEASVDGGFRCGKRCVYDAVDTHCKPPKPAVEYRHCPAHIHLDAKCFAGVSAAEIAAFDVEVGKRMDRSKSKLKEKAQILEERKKKLKHRTCREIIEEDAEFIDAWREEADSFVSGGYGSDLDEVTMKHSGYRHNQLMTLDTWNSYNGKPRRGQTFYHRMMLVNGMCCGVCQEPVVGRDENGNVRKDWSDPKAFYKYHLHHRTKKMSTPGYIVPAALPGRSLDFDKRMWHYSDLQVLCNHDHEQGENRIHWKVDRNYKNKIGYDDVPPKHVPIANVLKGDKWAAFKKAVEDYKLDSHSIIPHVSKRELDVIIFNATGYLPSDLATWANKDLPWERRGYRALGPYLIKTLALNFIKKECGVCLGRDGVECSNKDIRNETPQRMNGFHGDHGDNADIKEWNPAELVTKTWAEFEAELRKLEGFRCGCCHRNL